MSAVGSKYFVSSTILALDPGSATLNGVLAGMTDPVMSSDLCGAFIHT